MRVRYTPNSAAELAAVLDYIAERSPAGAKNVLARLRRIERTLADFPDIGERASISWLRRITATPYPYLIFYEVRASEVWIHRVRHAAKDPESR